MNLLCTFTMLLLVTQAPVPIPRQTTNTPATTRQQPTQQRQAPAKTSPSVGTPVAHLTTPETQRNDEQKGNDNQSRTVSISEFPAVRIAKDGYDWATIANFLLVAVGLGGIGTALWTLCYIRQQVGEMSLQRGVMKDTLTSINRQAGLMERQTTIQLVAMKQWVDCGEWAAAYDAQLSNCLRLSFTLTNPTAYLISVRSATCNFIPEFPEIYHLLKKGTALTPNRPLSFTLTIPLTVEKMGTYKLGMLGIVFEMKVVFMGILGEEVTQDIQGNLRCGPTRIISESTFTLEIGTAPQQS